MHKRKRIDTKPVLYVVATPIGNLRDISLRALDVLASVDLIAAEDTRTSRVLLQHYSISTKVIALHEHNERRAAARLVNFMKTGKSVALISDAGTPGINDPGAYLVDQARREGIPTIPVPGANAAVCALSVSGRQGSHFLFYGFLPATPGARRRALTQLQSSPYLTVFYESPHRILESVKDMGDILGAKREVIMVRELTKLFETVHQGSLQETYDWLLQSTEHQRGEFVILVSGTKDGPGTQESKKAEEILRHLLDELPLAQAVRLGVKITGEKKNLLYSKALLYRTTDKVE